MKKQENILTTEENRFAKFANNELTLPKQKQVKGGIVIEEVIIE